MDTDYSAIRSCVATCGPGSTARTWVSWSIPEYSPTITLQSIPEYLPMITLQSIPEYLPVITLVHSRMFTHDHSIPFQNIHPWPPWSIPELYCRWDTWPRVTIMWWWTWTSWSPGTILLILYSDWSMLLLILSSDLSMLLLILSSDWSMLLLILSSDWSILLILSSTGQCCY